MHIYISYTHAFTLTQFNKCDVLLQPEEPIEASILVTTKCELSENYQVMLRGLIVSRPPDPAKDIVVEELEPAAEIAGTEDRTIATPVAVET